MAICSTEGFCRSTDAQLLLLHPLLPFSTTALRTWQWSYSPAEQRLFSPNGSQWDYFHVTAGRRQSVNRHYRQGGSTDTLPIDVRAASVVKQRTHVQLISFGLPAASAPTPTHIQPFSTMLESLPPASKWVIQEYALPTNLAPFIASIKDGSARAVSDGSFKDRFGTAAFTIIAERDTSIIGLNIVPGHPSDQGAYRSELAGLFGNILVVNALCQWAGISGGAIKIGCDGLSALNKAFDTWPLEPADPHFDMLSSLRAMIAKSPLVWTTRHIEGHQDDDVNAKLDFWARQNIQMDNLAKIFWMHHSHSAHVQYPIMEEGFQVWLGDRKLSLHSSSVFFDHIHGKTILSWHASHGRFPAYYAWRVDWEVCHAALKHLPLGKRRWVTKHTSGFCSVGTKMVKWKEQPMPDCPCCGQIENTRHVWLCPEPAVFFVWYLLMSSFSDWLTSLHTAK
jgi:hypothetical protein